MGLFSKKKTETKKAKSYKELLLTLGIDIDSFKHEDLEPDEITIDDEVAGIVKKSSKIHEEEDAPYNIVDLSTTKEGKKELSLTIINDEYGIKEIVDKFSAAFGPDDDFKSEFTSEDLNEIRQPGFSTIRKYISDINGENYITISYSNGDDLSTTNIYIF
jgi:hypothetical protein